MLSVLLVSLPADVKAFEHHARNHGEGGKCNDAA
jgi:hypothetical protein